MPGQSVAEAIVVAFADCPKCGAKMVPLFESNVSLSVVMLDEGEPNVDVTDEVDTMFMKCPDCGYSNAQEDDDD